MDFKEPSVHASQRSRSNTNRSTTQVQQTIDSVATRVTIDPEGDVMKRTSYPLLLSYLISELVNIFTIFVVWHYAATDAIVQLSIAYPICYFVSQAIPKAITQAQVAFITKAIAESKIKQADECLAYHFLIQALYFIVALFFAFFLSISFRSQAGLIEGAENYASVYVPVICTIGTLLSIFNQSAEALLLVEGKNTFNMVRSIGSSLLSLLFILMAYQYSLAQNKSINLTQLAIGQIIGQLVPAVVMVIYYQDFKSVSFQGVLRAKFKYLKSLQWKQIGSIMLMALPKISQFGSQPLLVFCCNIVVTMTFTESSDIMIARVGLLIYYLGFNLFGFPMLTYIYTSEQELGLNLLQKKYIRSKEFLLKGLIWAVVIQAVCLILGFTVGKTVLEFFIPNSKAADKAFFTLYGEKYMTQAVLLPIIMIPFQYCQAVYAIESNWKMNLFLNIIHPIIGICTLLTVQFTVGDRADMYWVEFYADLFTGIAGLVLLVRKVFEVMQLAKIELRRLKKKKKLEEEGVNVDILDKQD
ncbi:DinF_protein [Hexamita inflata]|uniref:DinF_protein n=1 Tax=Hexamita inflata TaxID=28002 RepID=A0ABP1H6P2_9EUKA